uniref:Uncharacterized protein n=1 Tax=Amphimedon queenslandica TaxID=400682 RepID=A0A1X7U9B1_AMPQE
MYMYKTIWSPVLVKLGGDGATFHQLDAKCLSTAETNAVNGKVVNLKFLLGTDYKFLLILRSFNAANSNYACLYCSIRKDVRHNTQLQSEERTLNSVLLCAMSKTSGVVHCPLINVNIDKIIIDELRLFLQISDVLIRHLIHATVLADFKLFKDSTTHKNNLLMKTRNCDITFRVHIIMLISNNSQ